MPVNIRALYSQLSSRLAPVTEDASFEAAELVRFICGVSQTELFTGGREASDEEASHLRELAVKREAGCPLQYLLGEWDFYGRSFRVGEGVLIPRADTETLVEIALERAVGRAGLRLADICSGSGCIAITLAKELSDARVWAVEKSETAFCFLEDNIRRYAAAVTPVRDDALAPAGDYPQFDMILANPPYLTAADRETLQREVRFEPEMALNGGEDGLLFYRAIPAVWNKRLKSGGTILFEIGQGQETAVSEILKNNCFKNICTWRDLYGIIRVVGGDMPE